MIGETSIPPRFGRMPRIGRSSGSVSALRKFHTERTRSLRKFTTSKASSHEMIAVAMMT